MYAIEKAQYLYDAARVYFVAGSAVLFPTTFVIDAPFGRFAPSEGSWFTFDGRKSWVVMEIVSPIAFLYTLFKSPLSGGFLSPTSMTLPQVILSVLYLMHYTNRALISPYRSPSRSKAQLMVPLSGILFNILNGSLMGTYLSSPSAHEHLTPSHIQSPTFLVGVVLWTLGFIGNVAHDEILYDIRRKAHTKGKAKEGSASKKEHYAIPHGLLFRYISFPNYLCEWVEWFGFALAAAHLPSNVYPIWPYGGVKAVLETPYGEWAPLLTPPWIFLLNEIVLMFPRAYKGHQWYKTTFGETFPQERKIVVPFVL